MIARSLLALLGALAFPLFAMAQGGPPQDRYIVVLNEDVPILPENVAADVALQTGGRIGYVYEAVLQGFSITMPRAAAAAIARDPRIAYVEEDIPVSIFAQTVPTGIQRIFADGNTEIGIDDTDDYRVDVDVAVLDTGIDIDHPELNVVGGANCLQTSGGGPPWARTYYCDTGVSYDDDNSHGTHVGGTVGAIDNGAGVVGVAPGARLWAVKVLDSQGSGSLSGIIAGIDCVADPLCIEGDIEVINMSLGGSGSSTAMNESIANAVGAGITVVVSAGNSDADAANFTPANAPEAFTVSALADSDGAPGGSWSASCRTDQEDTLADFSNYGLVVDITAPGVCIVSTLPIEDGSYGTYSGTSMSSPHVAGAAGLLASRGMMPVEIRNTLASTGNFNWSDESGDGDHEPLLDVSDDVTFDPVLVASGGGGDDGGGTTDDPPTASFIYSCTNLACDFTDQSTDDGTLSWSWDFGDGSGTSTAQNPSHTYGADDTYTVTLTVTDDATQSDSDSQAVTVSDGSVGGGITLSVNAYKVRGTQFADLTWDGASGDDVDVKRDGSIDTTENDGAYTDSTGLKGGGSATYQVCEAGTETCSGEQTVTW